MNRIKILLATLLTTFLCVSQALADAIPADFIGDGKWVTLKTENGYYFYAIEEGNQIKLGQTKTAPTSENYAAYCWQIIGDATNGYTFCCLKYENSDGSETPAENKRYITNPETVAVAYNEVRLTNNPSKYYYTDKHQFQLVDNQLLYLAFYSSSWHTIRLHNSPDYVGSKMVIGGIFDWSVAAVVYGTETEDGEGHPQGTYLPSGGITYNGQNYVHGTSLHLPDQFNISIIQLSGYTKSTIKIDKVNRYIVAYYVGNESNITYSNAPEPQQNQNVVTGANNTIWALDAKKYITNNDAQSNPLYENVPANKAWQLEMVINNYRSGDDNPSFNKWGSCILSSSSDPFNTYYWNDFQVYQKSNGTLNFKSSKGDGMDHIIAENHPVTNVNYKVVIRYDGDKVYTIRTVILNSDFSETTQVYNNVWVSSRQQQVINQMSCALPTGMNIRDLKISIAEDSQLLEGQDYAIQNNSSKMYLSWDYEHSNDATKYRKMASYWAAASASKCQIEFTNSSVSFEGLHRSFYIKTEVWNGSSAVWKYVGANNEIADDDDNKKAFIYVNGKIVPVEDTQNPWGGSTTQWTFDMFANFLVQVEGNSGGAIMYKTTEQANNTYCEFPVNAQNIQYSNKSILGYTAEVTKENIALKVKYKPLSTGFYNFEDHRYSTPEPERKLVYYWDAAQQKLVSFAKNDWADWNKSTDNNLARGDAHQFTVTDATGLPVVLKKNTGGTNPDNKYYSSIYVPRALNLPNGVKAYYLKNVSGNTYILQLIEGSVLPASTAAVLISDNNPGGSWTFATTDATAPTDNMLSGSALPVDKTAESSVYVLSGNEGIGFYPYYPSTAAKIPAFKAYHQVTASTAKMFTFTFDDDITGITNIEKQPVEANDRYYDLSGRQITTPVRGHIYIHNGVKVLYK